MAQASKAQTIGNMLAPHIEMSEWGGTGPRRVTVRGRRPLKGGELRVEVRKQRGQPTSVRGRYQKGGARVQAQRDEHGRFVATGTVFF